MASEITEEDDREDSYFLHNREAQKEKIRKLIIHQKNHYQSTSSSSSSSSSSSTGATSRSSRSSFEQNQNRKLLNLMKKGSTSLRRLFDMEHTSLANHFDFYCCSPETKTIPLWGSDSDDAVHDDPWLGITKISSRFLPQEIEKHDQEHKQQKEYELGNQKLTRKKSFMKLTRFYKFRFRFLFRFRLKPKLRFCYRFWRRKKKA